MALIRDTEIREMHKLVIRLKLKTAKNVSSFFVYEKSNLKTNQPCAGAIEKGRFPADVLQSVRRPFINTNLRR